METNEKEGISGRASENTGDLCDHGVCTKMPYVYCRPESYDDQVFLFHKEDAKKLVEDYRQHENPIVAVKLENKQFWASIPACL